MKKKLIGLAILGIFLFVMTSFVHADTFTVGNDDNVRSITDTRADFAIVDTNNPASSNGEIVKIDYYASATKKFRFFIVDSSNYVKWVSDEIDPTSSVEDTFTLPTPEYIKPGWNIGLYFAETGAIPFDYGGAPASYTVGGYGIPTEGSVMTYQSSSNRTYSFVATVTVLPYGVIKSLEEDEIVYGNTELLAEYYDGDEQKDDTVSWAVRYNTCNAATNTVFGNVDGHHDNFEWDGKYFSATIDTSLVEAGRYCFVFNPKDDSGEVDVRETREFYIADGFVSGGGHILEEEYDEESVLLKRKDWKDISFGGSVWDVGSYGYMGEWQVNFHNVEKGELDKSKFHSTSILSINFFTGNSNTCESAMNMTMLGTLDGKPGYSMIFRAGDAGSPNNGGIDTVRVQLFNGIGEIYDTHDGDFDDQSSCVGSARTYLDTGNIKIGF
jgi:hypothetical protein